jgi:hypothetical protein
MDAPTFPLVAIKGDGLEMKMSPVQLRLASPRALRPGGWFDGGGPTLLDATGIEYRMRNVRFARRTGRKAFPGLFAPRLIEVDFELERVGARSINDVRALLVTTIQSAPSAWDGSEYGVESVLRDVADAQSVEALWSVLVNVLGGSGWTPLP